MTNGKGLDSVLGGVLQIVLLVGSGIETALQWEKYTMSNNNTPKTKEPTDAKQQPLKTIRRGAVAASIWKRHSSTGFE